MQTLDRLAADPVRSSTAARWLPPLLLLALGFVLVPWAHTCQLSCVPGDLGDARFNGVILEHFHRWLSGHESSLISPRFFFPVPGALTFSDNHWGTAWIYSLYRLMGWDRYQAFDLWYLTGYLANFTVSHIVFRRLRFSPLASALAAFAFTFAMPAIARHTHAQLNYRLMLPIGLLLWQRFVVDGRWRWIAGLAVAVVVQFYISIYLGYFMLLLLAAWGVAQWGIEGIGPRRWFAQWQQWRQPAARRELAWSSAILVVAGIALVALMAPYLYYSRLYGFVRSVEEVATLLPRPASYFLADTSWVWARFSALLGADVPMRHEHQIFFGVGALGLAALGVCRSALRTRWVALASIALLILLTLSVHGVSLYMLLAGLPGIGSVRAMARIGVALALPLAVLVAIGVDTVRRGRIVWQLLAAVLALLMVVEAATIRTAKFDIADARRRIATLQHGLPSPLAGERVLFNPIRAEVPASISELDGMILAQTLGHSTLNGYSGNLAPGYEPREQHTPCTQAMLRVHAGRDRGRMTAATAAALDDIVIIGQADCEPQTVSILPLADASKLGLRIVSIVRQDDGYHVHARIVNATQSSLNTTGLLPEPLRLSWQVVGPEGTLDAAAWVPRIDLPGQAVLAAGETRDVEFVVPAPGTGGRAIAISAVLEGRVWLHEYGLSVAVAPVETPASAGSAAAGH